MRPDTFAMTEKGGFISATLGAMPAPRWSSICAASNRVTVIAGKRASSSFARISASSFSTSFAPATSAKIASRPVPTDGSSTQSAGVMAAAIDAAKPSGIGVENC